MQIIPWNGKRISKPGCYSGIPIERYHSAQALCRSRRIINRSATLLVQVASAYVRPGWCREPEG